MTNFKPYLHQKFTIVFSDPDLALLSSSCCRVTLPMGNDNLKIALNDDENSNVKRLIESYLGKTIDNVVVTIYKGQDVVKQQTFSNFKMVPVSFELDTTDSGMRYNIEIVDRNLLNL